MELVLTWLQEIPNYYFLPAGAAVVGIPLVLWEKRVRERRKRRLERERWIVLRRNGCGAACELDGDERLLALPENVC